MSGTYDAGFGDMTAIIQNAAARPADAPVMVYMIYNQPPFAVMSLPSANIKTPKDLAGRRCRVSAAAADDEICRRRRLQDRDAEHGA